jgi:dTDP-4-amino-4,6-dideoxygalactose transaminase
MDPLSEVSRGPLPGSTLESTPIPLVDLAFQHAEVAVEIVEAIVAVMSQGGAAEARAVSRFESAMAASWGRRHCFGVADGTDTLALLLRAAGIGAGDEVILPANGRLAVVAAVIQAGAWPVLADCDPVHHLLDPDAVRQRITRRTRAVVALHLYGQMAPVEDLAAIARSSGAVLFEDAAQCAGARRHGEPPGQRSAAVITSFHPGMSLGAYGGGGAVLTDDDALAVRLRALPRPGFDASEAIVLTAKLGHLVEWNALREKAGRFYAEMLDGDDRIVLPTVLPGNTHVWHRYVVRVGNRDGVLAEMLAGGIEAAVHYRVPLHLLAPSEILGYRPGDFPHTEAAADEMLSLPIHPGIRYQQVERVADALRRALPR